MQIRPGGFRNYVFLAVCLLVLVATVSPTVGHREDKTELADALRELAALIVDEMYEADRGCGIGGNSRAAYSECRTQGGQ